MPSSKIPLEWQAPRSDASESYKLGWLNASVEQGESWVSSQRGYADLRKGLDILSGVGEKGNILDYRSQISGRRLKTNIRVVVAGLSNIRPLWGFNAAKEYASYAMMLNKTSQALYLEGYWDQSVKEALAYAAATCTGWLRPVATRDQAGKGTWKIKLLSYGMPCVLPVQMPSDGDYQEAYCVNLLDEVPIYMAHSKFPLFQDRLHPTSSRYWYSAEIRGSARSNASKRAANWAFGRSGKGKDNLNDLYIPIRWTTIIDHTINTTGYRQPMGEPGASWYYEVPSLGDEISDGHGGSRKADENDARMYPYRRLMISSEDCVMYDGPAFNWHGQLDLIPFTIDKWPWEPIGFSMVHDGWELQKSIDQVDRGTMDKIAAQLDMPLGYDINAVDKREAEQFDPMEPRARIGYDGSQVEKPFASPVPPETYRIEPEILSWREQLQSELDYQTQSRDVVELGKAQALGKGMDQLEALISANGPLVKDMSRSMENSLGRVGSQVGWLILQYMPTSRVMQYVGLDGMTPEVFDYRPDTIVPSHMPGEIKHDANQVMIPSKYSIQQRARWFGENVHFYLMPHSVHEITQMTYRLMLLQLKQRGAPISWATIMQSCEIPNVAEPSGNTEQEKAQAEKDQEIQNLIRTQVIIKGLGIEEGLVSAVAPSAVPSQPQANGSTSQGGRPATLATPPHLEQKGNGRPVTSTSQ